MCITGVSTIPQRTETILQTLSTDRDNASETFNFTVMLDYSQIYKHGGHIDRKKNIDMLETVQRATKIIPKRRDMTYEL